MELDEACLYIRDLINNGLHSDVASCEISRQKGRGIWLSLKRRDFHNWDSILMAGFFEQIYAKTGLMWVALNRHDDGVTISLSDSNYLTSCDKDATPWEDTKYRAKCPKCGEREAYDLMRYDPEDHRGMTCTKCGYEGHVYNFWNDVK